ncbi:hypothetical protein M9H77_35275 [Catharanthus roseus]|uniref:Uncharacterized protein n=1 Tax=Catharanthus roseus TaxID=4058 RepID=A0ACB9ZS75_CATRO|nr:hypothetical protein M9H77_35275 [Catharanthus roseus]
MFLRVNAPGLSVLPPPIPTRVRMPHDPHTPSHPGASSSLVHHLDASYMHDIHHRHIPMPPGAQYSLLILDDFLIGAFGDSPLYEEGYYNTSEQRSSYAPGFGDVQGGHSDKTTVEPKGDGEGGDVDEGQDVQESRRSEDVQCETLGPSGVGGGKKSIVKMINDDLGVRLSVSRGSDVHHRILMSVVCTSGDSARLSMEMRASCYLLSILGNSLFLNKSGLPMANYELWPIVRNLRRCNKMACGCCSIDFVMMGQRSGAVVLSNYWMRLDVMIAVEPHMLERCVRQFGRTQGIPHAPIISLVEHYRLPSTKSYVYDAVIHCVHVDHMRHIAMPPHAFHPS